MKLNAVNTFLALSLMSWSTASCWANAPFNQANQLPESVAKAIKKSGIPGQSISISVDKISYQNQQGPLFTTQKLIHWQENSPMNPASTMKLVTSLAAMEVLGPQYRWKTDLLTNGKIQNGLLKGDLLIRGSGDPKLIPEEINKMLLNLQSMGVKKIDGNLSLDRSAYESSVKETSFSDGEPTRAYNVAPDALLFAFNSFSFQFYPNTQNDVVVIKQTPRMANFKIDNNLKIVEGPCLDWRKDINMSLTQSTNGSWVALFDGAYPSGCQNATWNVVASDSDSFFIQSFIAAWEDIGGTWVKKPILKTHDPKSEFKPIVAHLGVPLYESVKDINKFSNNVMARQVMLTMALEKTGKPSNTNNSMKIIKEWLISRQLNMPELVIENGSGLSRIERISSQHLNQILLLGLNSRSKDYFLESLPIAGFDGTMRHRLLDKFRKYVPNKKEVTALQSNTANFPNSLKKYGAFIKTGSLVDVRCISGYVVSRSGHVYAVTSFINDPNARNGRGIHDEVLSWLLDDGPIHQNNKAH
ncbi:D-alanyl-D-alanine carboxypeptidase/D-alanyl-D-alanine-endopeptidase [Polynucleobacter sp. 30F-ANTBAC]|uniref:D-alanyl-D-alanine carboxypeptidase/D-alanyl-D-alanine endopeptidase n=1 Tax=Polynucleobacter sp. 30F-ANTBAC TaxID=2689095 RepID=UPI001C0E449B|nr:D-alanyl-D-alanine carboxypeptidase/D-alanyl-D-alanine-endopeptidase [Polynucleobacter sp. 30F-ANTBAC]MBU3600280.1 D-alanyl-D-alanine carboxypeptidase/D-alanyl-D-alanine-endopeptidase [Polynucleobacter sp. 30F-ANTBAC]